MDDQTPRGPVITDRAELPEGQRKQFDRIEESRGQVRGPFRVLLNSPELGGRVAHLGAYIRFESQLSGQERELTILTTARAFDCAYEWAAHEPLAREAGVRDEALEVLTGDRNLDTLTDTEAIVVRYARALLRDHEVSEERFQTTKDHFGVQGLTDLTATIGYYSLIACVLNAFEMTLEEPA